MIFLIKNHIFFHLLYFNDFDQFINALFYSQEDKMIKAEKIINLPIGFADQVLELEMSLEEEESLELIQILCQMYRIGVDYYLENDLKKAVYFQNKINTLAVKSLNANSVEGKVKLKEKLSKQIRFQVNKFTQNERTYVKTMVEKSLKSQKKIKEFVEADLNRQEQNFKGRMLRRVKSQGKL